MTANPSEVQAQLERILASSVFSASARSAQFLRFCVEQSLQGNQDQIKESTVAVEVFGRTPDYNPRTDPIVRVHAKRLREKLDVYYTAQGTHDPIRITIPKGGYIPQAVRTLPVTKIDFSDWPSDKTDKLHAATIQNISKTKALWFSRVTIVLLLMIIAAIVFAYHRTATHSPVHILGEAFPLNASPGRERNPSWSPNGQLLAFSWDGGSRESQKIYLQKIGQSQPYRLTRSLQPEYRPVWSPDGKDIAFIRYLDSGHFEVLQDSLADGSEQSIGVFTYYWPILEDAPALDWSPDGKSLLVAEQSSALSPVRLLLFTLATGERRPLTNPTPGTSGDLEGKFSPNGTLVAFHRGGFGDLYLVSIDGEAASPAHKLTMGNPGIIGISWTRDGKRILFGSHQDGSEWGIWQVDVDGKNLSALLSGGFDATSPTVSPDGASLAVEHENRITNLTAISLDKTKPDHLFAPSSRQDYSPVFSPDGKKVVFVSTRSGPMELWLANADGSNIQQLTKIGGAGFPLSPSWAADGKKILFSLRKEGQTNLAISNVRDGAIQQLTFGHDRALSPFYSSDGQYIYFISNSGGVGSIWRMSADGSGHAEQMYWDVAGLLQASQDHKSVLFKDSEPELHIVKRDLATGSLQSVFHSEKRLSSFDDFCAHGNTLYIMLSSVKEPAQSDLLAVDIKSGKTRFLQSFDRTSSGLESGCTVSPDGKTLLLTTVQQQNSDIYLAKLAH
jgi:Tol biopolymer transport system component